ncbi:double zinc ribbon domain-containing protein, partial [Burkholderia sp. Ac-20353]|uniref:double zinc ribbon domain-containing protein n=1 Tax=Burkholderia sp. Ac-20353 TaxID=2703894 RepID=UPI00321687BE|nr:ComF family protein [Burkholderia sp. Ac-20353]
MNRRPFPQSIRVVMSQAFARIAAIALPNRCALCGNLSRTVICAECDAAYWNEARVRCAVCAVPLAQGHAQRAAGYQCDACRATPPPFDATFALADYRAPLDGLARGLKFHARLALGAEFAGRLARLIA